MWCIKDIIYEKMHGIASFKIFEIFRLSLANLSGCSPPWPVGT